MYYGGSVKFQKVFLVSLGNDEVFSIIMKVYVPPLSWGSTGGAYSI